MEVREGDRLIFDLRKDKTKPGMKFKFTDINLFANNQTTEWKKINIRLPPEEEWSKNSENVTAFQERSMTALERKRERNRAYSRNPKAMARRRTPEYIEWKRKYDRERWQRLKEMRTS